MKTMMTALKNLSEATLTEMKGDLMAAMDAGIESQAEYDAVEAMYNAVKKVMGECGY